MLFDCSYCCKYWHVVDIVYLWKFCQYLYFWQSPIPCNYFYCFQTHFVSAPKCHQDSVLRASGVIRHIQARAKKHVLRVRACVVRQAAILGVGLNHADLDRASSRKSPKGGAKIGFQKFQGVMHLATLMHSNHVICIIGVSRG